MMKKKLITFYADVSLRNRKRHEQGFPTECGMQLHFLSTCITQAVQDAMRFAKNRVEGLPEMFEQVNAIKVYYFTPHVIEPDGEYIEAVRGCLFEWKCDWPGKFEDYVQAINEHKPGIKSVADVMYSRSSEKQKKPRKKRERKCPFTNLPLRQINEQSFRDPTLAPDIKPPVPASPELTRALNSLLPPALVDFEELFGSDKEEIDKCLDRRDIIGAIKLLRNKSSMGLYESKTTIDQYITYRKEKKQWNKPTPASTTE